LKRCTSDCKPSFSASSSPQRQSIIVQAASANVSLQSPGAPVLNECAESLLVLRRQHITQRSAVTRAQPSCSIHTSLAVVGFCQGQAWPRRTACMSRPPARFAHQCSPRLPSCLVRKALWPWTILQRCAGQRGGPERARGRRCSARAGGMPEQRLLLRYSSCPRLQRVPGLVVRRPA